MAVIRFPAGERLILGTSSRPVLGPKQPPIQSVPGALFRWNRGQIMKLTPSIVEVRLCGALPILLHTLWWCDS